MATKIILEPKKYEEFETLLIDNAHIWGLDNLDVIEIISHIREITNARKQ